MRGVEYDAEEVREEQSLCTAGRKILFCLFSCGWVQGCQQQLRHVRHVREQEWETLEESEWWRRRVGHETRKVGDPNEIYPGKDVPKVSQNDRPLIVKHFGRRPSPVVSTRHFESGTFLGRSRWSDIIYSRSYNDHYTHVRAYMNASDAQYATKIRKQM